MRSSHRGGVADQRDAAVHHLVDQQIVDRREEGFGDAKQDIAHRRRQELSRVFLETCDDISSDFWRGNRYRVVHPVFVDQQIV